MVDRKYAEWDSAYNEIMQMAKEINNRLSSAGDVNALLNQQTLLIDQAGEISRTEVRVLLGDLGFTTAQIGDAIRYANGVLKDIADANKAIEKIGMVIDFVTVLLSKNPSKIYLAGKELRDGLDKA